MKLIRIAEWIEQLFSESECEYSTHEESSLMRYDTVTTTVCIIITERKVYKAHIQ